ncbi:flagellar biosynthetic protein FliQ [Acidisoma sp. 7E03]
MTAATVDRDAWLAFAQLCGPVILLMFVLGIAVGILQTATQLRDSSLPFIVKVIGVALLCTFVGGFMMAGVERYATRLLLAIPALLHG